MPPRSIVPKVIFIVIVLIAAAASIWYVRSRGAQPLRVAVMTWAGAGPGFVAIERGFFGAMPVEIRILDDTKARQAAYNSADFEVYLTNPDQHPREVSVGLPGTMVLLSDVSYGADGLLARSDISDVRQLKGKRVAYTQGTASDFMLSKALQSAGLSRSDVTLVSVDDPGVALAALTGGSVDAAMSWEPLMSEAVKGGRARILFTSRDTPDTILGVFIAKESLLGDEKRFRQFVSGWLRAVDDIKDNPESTYPIMSRAFNVSDRELRAMMDGLRLADRAKNREFFTPDAKGLTLLDHFVNDAAAYWRSVGLLEKNGDSNNRWVRPDVVALLSAQ